MKKESAFWNDKHHGFVKFAVVTSIVVLLFLLFRSNGVINWIRSGHEIRRQEKMIREYRRDIEKMDRTIYDLTHDKDSLEKHARELFHMTAPGEDVYIEE